MTRRCRLPAVLLALAVVVAAGCGGDTAVGEGVNLNIKDQADDQLRLGETTTTTAPEEEAAGESGGRAALGDTTTTALPTTTTTVAAREVALEVSINSDTSGSTQFVPSAARVFAGSLVEFVNTDTVARSVVADNGAFDSGMIPPGATWQYDATQPGSFNYHDGTRPYAVGTIEVVAR